VLGTVAGVPVTAPFAGLVRGLVADGTPVTKGLKIGDVDPRTGTDWHQISDKALAVAGGVLEAILTWQHPGRSVVTSLAVHFFDLIGAKKLKSEPLIARGVQASRGRARSGLRPPGRGRPGRWRASIGGVLTWLQGGTQPSRPPCQVIRRAGA
jgi:hypothetical protein